MVYKDGREEIVSNPALFPENHDATMRIERVEEPIGKRIACTPSSRRIVLTDWIDARQ